MTDCVKYFNDGMDCTVSPAMWFNRSHDMLYSRTSLYMRRFLKSHFIWPKDRELRVKFLMLWYRNQGRIAFFVKMNCLLTYSFKRWTIWCLLRSWSDHIILSFHYPGQKAGRDKSWEKLNNQRGQRMWYNYYQRYFDRCGGLQEHSR